MLRNSDWTSDGCSSDLATATGRAIVRASADNLARVTLELGGKSPAIVLPDAELDLAIPGIANGIFGNGGQVCVANSRVYAHEDIFDALVEGLAAQAAGLALGHQLNPDTAMGPLVSAATAERGAGFVDEARGDGAGVDRKVGKEGVSTCRSRWAPYHYNKNKT